MWTLRHTLLYTGWSRGYMHHSAFRVLSDLDAEAEPLVALDEQGGVNHIGIHAEL